MGQRLDIEIIKNNKVVGNCYYHWGAYTASALELSKGIIESYNAIEDKNIPDEVIAVMSFSNAKNLNIDKNTFELVEQYPGLSEESLKYMKEKYPEHEWKVYVDRNAGIIGVTEDDMNFISSLAEGIVMIDLDSKTVDASNMLVVFAEESFIEDWDISEDQLDADGKLIRDEYRELEYSELGAIPFDEIDNALAIIDGVSCLISKNDTENIYIVIE